MSVQIALMKARKHDAPNIPRLPTIHCSKRDWTKERHCLAARTRTSVVNLKRSVRPEVKQLCSVVPNT